MNEIHNYPSGLSCYRFTEKSVNCQIELIKLLMSGILNVIECLTKSAFSSFATRFEE
jgi:hypothetical protein